MADAEEPDSPSPTHGDDLPSVFESLLALEFPPPEFPKLQDEYYHLWSQMVINAAKLIEVDNYVDRMTRYQGRYDSVSEITEVPWYTIALIHCLEGDLNFATHLHNGDPLTARTVNDPKGRPRVGTPPFTWENSAVDALRYDNIAGTHEGSVAGIAYLLEGYNGWGYRYYHPEVKDFSG